MHQCNKSYVPYVRTIRFFSSAMFSLSRGIYKPPALSVPSSINNAFQP